MRVWTHAPGPQAHGVVRHARVVADLIEKAGGSPVDGPDAADVVHTHFTDALWGPSIETAADRFVHWARAVRRPIVVTLHDAADGDGDVVRRGRRAAGYRAVLAEAAGGIVAHRHEADAVTGLSSRPVRVIELPMGARSPWPRPPAATARRSVGVLGFVYPGKGHLAVLRAAAEANADLVVHLGGPSPGHAHLERQLAREANRLGIRLHATGHLSERAMAEGINQVTVPVWAARGTQASGSLVTWIAHGRRPLAVSRPVSIEVSDSHPNCLDLVPEPALAGALGEALRAPERTWLGAPPEWSPVGELHLRAFEELTG